MTVELNKARPTLIVVTGRPGSGKSTLVKTLVPLLQAQPVYSKYTAGFETLCRDEVKTDYLRERGMSHAQAPQDVNQQVTRLFVDLLTEKLSRGASVIVDAAFQQPLWKKVLMPLMAIARVKIVICHIRPELALERYEKRLVEQGDWQYFHGDETPTDLIRGYQGPTFDLPTLHLDMEQGEVDTAGVLAFIRQ